MKRIRIVIAIVSLSFLTTFAQEHCLTEENLKNLDASWEKAQLELNLEFISSLLAEDFIWVHNHAKTIDDKPAVLERVKRYLKNNNRSSTKSRSSKDVKVIISGTTGIVSGITIIDRGPSPTTYHIMRTYIETNGKCYLIANHTMAIPDED